MLLQIQIDRYCKIIFKCKEPLLSPLKLQKIQITWYDLQIASRVSGRNGLPSQWESLQDGTHEAHALRHGRRGRPIYKKKG